MSTSLQDVQRMDRRVQDLLDVRNDGAALGALRQLFEGDLVRMRMIGAARQEVGVPRIVCSDGLV